MAWRSFCIISNPQHSSSEEFITSASQITTSVKWETYTIKKEQLLNQGLSNSDKNKTIQEPNAFFAFNKQIYPFFSSFWWQRRWWIIVYFVCEQFLVSTIRKEFSPINTRNLSKESMASKDLSQCDEILSFLFVENRVILLCLNDFNSQFPYYLTTLTFYTLSIFHMRSV